MRLWCRPCGLFSYRCTRVRRQASNPQPIGPLHPGELLCSEWLEPLGISAYRLAKDIAVPPNSISENLAGRRAISAETALRLARYFGTDAQSWINLQAAYDLAVAQRNCGEAIAREVRPRAA